MASAAAYRRCSALVTRFPLRRSDHQEPRSSKGPMRPKSSIVGDCITTASTAEKTSGRVAAAIGSRCPAGGFGSSGKGIGAAGPGSGRRGLRLTSRCPSWSGRVAAETVAGVRNCHRESPVCKVAPAARVMGSPPTGMPFTQVPFVDSRSRTVMDRPATVISACRRDKLESPTRIGVFAPRPSTCRPGGRSWTRPLSGPPTAWSCSRPEAAEAVEVSGEVDPAGRIISRAPSSNGGRPRVAVGGTPTESTDHVRLVSVSACAASSASSNSAKVAPRRAATRTSTARPAIGFTTVNRRFTEFPPDVDARHTGCVVDPSRRAQKLSTGTYQYEMRESRESLCLPQEGSGERRRDGRRSASGRG